MLPEVGDKVRFLNEPIEGTLHRLLPNSRAEVVDSDGFTHVVPINQLVRIEFGLDERLSVPQSDTVRSQPQERRVEQTPVAAAIANDSWIRFLEPDQTVYFATVLTRPESPLVSDVAMRLINNTQWTILFTFSRKAGDVRSGVRSGTLESRNEEQLGVFSADELHRIRGFEFQILFFGEREYGFRPPIVRSLAIAPNDFLEPSFRDRLPGHPQTVLLHSLAEVMPKGEVDISKLLEKFSKDEIEAKERQSGSRPSRSGKFTIMTRERIVDLHIEELIKEPTGMSNAQIISYQLNHFQKELDRAIVDRLHKITFIHGVGSGVLRSSIREELKKYPAIRFQDAPPEQFGYGATEVLFQ
jgi:hypothetical protein